VLLRHALRGDGPAARGSQGRDGGVGNEIRQNGEEESGLFSRRGSTENKKSAENKKSSTESKTSSTETKKSSWSCCKKGAASQVVEPSQAPPSGGSTQNSKRRVSFRSPRKGSPQSGLDSKLAKPRPAFDEPLDDSSVVIDTKVDYYGILGVAPRASSADIKQAYHKLARESHPDKNPSDEASAQFQKVKLAYAILGDATRKAQYDDGR